MPFKPKDNSLVCAGCFGSLDPDKAIQTRGLYYHAGISKDGKRVIRSTCRPFVRPIRKTKMVSGQLDFSFDQEIPF